jgi:N-acetylmuramoyl-L-alanine amidase
MIRDIKYIVLHCTATPQTTTVKQIQDYWKNIKGWNSPGYHNIILPNGKIENILDINKISNGVAGYNSNSIHISYVGGVDAKNIPIDNRTSEQKDSMIILIKKYKALFPNAEILGHRDFPNVKKACPSFDVRNWIKTIEL